jgi:hypothetical protein
MQLNKTCLLIEAVDSTEYNNLSDANKDRFALIVSAGLVDLTEGSNAVNALWAMFDEESASRAAIQELFHTPTEPEE